MEKVKLTEEQAKALESLKGTWSDKEPSYYYPIIIKEKLRGGWRGYGSYAAAESLSDDDFIKALYFGYEVEKTPEQLVHEYAKEVRTNYFIAPSGTPEDHKLRGEMEGIRRTVNILGIKIEGVNE